MYYLDCMCSVLNLQDRGYNLARLTDYHKYYLLSPADDFVLLGLCMKVNPEKMDEKCIFLNEAVCGSEISNNEFYNISANETSFAVAESVLVGERRVTVRRIMCYNRLWVVKYFIDPFVELGNRLKSAGHQPPIKGDNCGCCSIL